MIRNLLENAQRHAGGATRIQIGTDASRHALVIVEDHGSGVPEADREKIFEPFYRAGGASVSARGSGLGLAIVRQIARAHGGNASYTTLESGGSSFVVTLPVKFLAGTPPHAAV
jgi:signal transduction histidine kinase